MTIKVDEHVRDSLMMSMVEDMFYIFQICRHRSTFSSNIDAVIQVLSKTVSLFGSDNKEALQQKVRDPYLGGNLLVGGICVQKIEMEIFYLT